MSAVADDGPGHGELVIPTWAEGRPGLGQGGYSAARFQALVDQPIAVNFRAPIPLETPLVVRPVEGGWAAVDPDPRGRGATTTIMDAVPLAGVVDHFASTTAVSLDEARIGRSNFGIAAEEHNAPRCFSCGIHEASMRIHAGRLADGSPRTATDWTPPPPVGDERGIVAEAVVWTVMDCAQAFYVGTVPERREAVTVRYAVEVLAPLRVGRPYAVVAFDGRWSGGWNGRKRGAGANIFDEAGELVARSDSLWLEPRTITDI